jgi:hypothetical protein
MNSSRVCGERGPIAIPTATVDRIYRYPQLDCGMIKLIWIVGFDYVGMIYNIEEIMFAIL